MRNFEGTYRLKPLKLGNERHGIFVTDHLIKVNVIKNKGLLKAKNICISNCNTQEKKMKVEIVGAHAAFIKSPSTEFSGFHKSCKINAYVCLPLHKNSWTAG